MHIHLFNGDADVERLHKNGSVGDRSTKVGPLRPNIDVHRGQSITGKYTSGKRLYLPIRHGYIKYDQAFYADWAIIP